MFAEWNGVMPQNSISVDDFMQQAAAILVASKAKRGDGMVMVTIEPDDSGPTAGAAAGTDGEDEDDKPAGQDEGEGDGGDDDKPFVKEDGTPFTARDYNALRDSLKAARAEVRQVRRTATTKPAEGDEDKDKAAAEDAAKAADARWKPVVVRQAARAAFAEAGLLLPKGREESALKKALKLIDTDELDVTADGDVDGLDDQITDLKADYPELFAKTRAPRVENAPKGAGPEVAKSSAQQIADALLA